MNQVIRNEYVIILKINRANVKQRRATRVWVCGICVRPFFFKTKQNWVNLFSFATRGYLEINSINIETVRYRSPITTKFLHQFTNESDKKAPDCISI